MPTIDNANQVREALREQGLLVDPLSKWERYESLASAVVKALAGGRNLTATQVDELVRGSSTGSKNSTKARLKVKRLLEAGNRGGLWESPLPYITTVYPRPSASPVSPSQQRQRDGAVNLERYFRIEYLRPDLRSEAALLGAALLLVTRVGAAEPVIYGVLANLRRADFDKKTGWLNTPSHPAVDALATYRLKLPEPLAGLLRWQRRNIARRNGCWFFTGSLPGDAGDEPPDAEMVKRRIGESYERLVKDYRSNVGEDGSPVPKAFRGFVGAGRHRARDLGLTPQFLTVMAGYPLPVSPPAVALLADEPAIRTAWQSGASEPARPILSLNASDRSKAAPKALPGEFDWIGFAQGEIAAFLHQLRPFCAPTGGVTSGRDGEVYDLLGHFDVRASSVLDTPNILRILLRFAVSKLLDGLKHESLKSTISALSGMDLLAEPAYLDLSTWDEETVVELAELRMDQQEQNAIRTRQTRIADWVALLNFAHDQGVGHFPLLTVEGIMSLPAGRSEILTPDEAQQVHWRLRHLHGASHRERLLLVSAFALGMHAGLRASEVIDTTLANCVVEEGRVYLHIPHGKRRKSRRQLWLHAFLPPNDLQWLIEYIRLRSDERMSHLPLDQVYLFGQAGDPAPSDGRAIIDKLIPEMTAFLGRPVDFHLLRHSFCSWLVVQAYLIVDPWIEKYLPGLDPRLKEPDTLAGVAEYLRYPLPTAHKDAGMKHDIWNRIARTMGHSSPRTLMTTYAHTLGPIHSVSLGATSEWTRRDRL